MNQTKTKQRFQAFDFEKEEGCIQCKEYRYLDRQCSDMKIFEFFDVDNQVFNI